VTLREYVDVARDRWRFVLAGLVLGLLVAAAVTVLTPRQYSAEVTVIVSAQAATDDPATAFDGEALSAQRVRTYIELMRSKRLASDVVDALGLDITPEELAGRITATTAPDTVLLTAAVTDESPGRVVQIANVVAEQFITNVAELEQPADPARAPLVAARVFEAAAPPVDVVAPRPVLYMVLGAVLGLLAGLGAALLRNALDTSVKRRRQLEEILDAPVLGEIGRDAKIVKSPLVAFDDPHAPLAEAFRQLRTNVRFIDVDREHKVILVTSASPVEGKSATVCNLGLALAEAGTRVLIVDADLRRPTVARCLGVDGTIGLTNVLVNRLAAAQAIQPAGPALDVLPSGLTPPNPSELLGSEQMANLIAELRGSYDVILIDTSPLLPVTDAAVLAPRADGVIIVVRQGKTTVHDVQAARDALDTVSGRILGSVMTMVRGTGSQRYTKYSAYNDRVQRAAVPASGVRPPGVRQEPADDRTIEIELGRVTGNHARRPSPSPSPSPSPRPSPTNSNGQPLEREGGQASG
jgi:capsular exopolysaccharide synthesis family protein